MKISPTPVTWLKLGSINTMVIQSAQAAVEFFKGHDLAFADRKCPHALKALGYDQGSLAVGRYSGSARSRRLCSAELLVTKRINETAHLRQKCVDSVIVYLEEEMAEMFFAGSETTSSTIEWAMTELLRQPESMKKAKYKIDQETKFMGFDIPKDTQVFVNGWSIGRDPDAWEDRLAFKPERFMGSKIDYKGQNFELIPFGSGRRICVGLSLADRVLHLGLATLLYHFDWELGDGSTPKTLDMKERVGIILRKLHPLKVIPKNVACEV
ncbi:iridoid oxidase-like [Eucalyptus grandis]|uniref:iridoid oxidase-like n=1 Tax=Eucalyptus grandis TaxID=71139 RepID=UPI00192F006D|nr:iridoid oxidase-like [Eucalyptus grandis]